jgi:hypothetical protein
MVVSVLRAITWGTLAAAVTSAALLTASGGMSRMASISGDLSRGPAPATQAAVDASTRSALPTATSPTATR